MDALFGLIGFFIGIALGSFIKVLADRSLTKKSFLGRSYCLSCKRKLNWFDLFPIFSYLFLKGRCGYCHNQIGIEYLVVEVITGILIAFLFWQSFSNFQFSSLQSILNFQFIIFILELLLKIFFIMILITLFITDLRVMLIPDRIIIPSLIIGLIFTILVAVLKIIFFYYSLSQSAIGHYLLPPYTDYFQRHVLALGQALMGNIISGLLIAGFFMSLIIITRGKGMGGGDVKLGAFLGLMLGFPQSLIAIIFSFILGALVSIILIVFKKKHFGQSIPFGPFLVLGSLICLFFGNQILDWYLLIS